MKPTKSKLLLLDKSAKWWLNNKSNSIDFAFMKGEDWYIVRSSERFPKSTKKPANLFKNKTKKARLEDDRTSFWLTAVILASVLGVSLALNFWAFLSMT